MEVEADGYYSKVIWWENGKNTRREKGRIFKKAERNKEVYGSRKNERRDKGVVEKWVKKKKIGY